MKTILSSALLLASLTTMAQSGEFISYQYSGKNKKISVQLPKGAAATPGGRFVINGKSYHMETVDAKPYLEKGTAQDDTVKSKREKDITVLAYFFPERSKMLESIGKTDEVTDNQMKVSNDDESLSCWYSYNKSNDTMTTNLEGGKVIGDEIFIVVMDDKVPAKSAELKQQRNLIFEILDSATAVKVKTN